MMEFIEKDRGSFDDGTSLSICERVYEVTPCCAGHIEMQVEERSGKKWTHYSSKNLIVNSSRLVLANLISLASSAYKVSKAKFGNSIQSPEDGELANPSLPDPTDTALNDPTPTVLDIQQSPLPTIITNPDTGVVSVQFTIVMGYLDGNETDPTQIRAYTEMGLFTVNNTMYSRRTFPCFYKNLNRKLTVLWTIAF